MGSPRGEENTKEDNDHDSIILIHSFHLDCIHKNGEEQREEKSTELEQHWYMGGGRKTMQWEIKDGILYDKQIKKSSVAILKV